MKLVRRGEILQVEETLVWRDSQNRKKQPAEPHTALHSFYHKGRGKPRIQLEFDQAEWKFW